MPETEEKKCACPTCGQGSEEEQDFDPFGIGHLLDDHMDCDVSEEEMTKRVSDAVQMGARLGGKAPGGIVDELGALVAPKLTWQDFALFVKQRKKQQSSKKNDWNLPRRKPLMSGMYSPTKRDFTLKVLLALDSSGSMSNEQITYALSQVQVLDGKATVHVVFWDSQPFWEDVKILQKVSKEELGSIKRIGGGGTVLAPVFKEYEEEVGPVDLIIIGSDFFLADEIEVSNLPKPKDAEVIFLSVNGNPKFKYPFGRAFHLYNE